MLQIKKLLQIEQNFEKWLSIAIFGHLAKAIARQNGYKMVDLGTKF